MASTTSAELSLTSQPVYKVFLSFRGIDTRKTFIDHLYIALVQAGIHSFKDDDEMERGGDIQYELARAIQQSQIYVIILSKNYASSRWCLDELVNILERKKTVGQVVLPVFYHIDPSDVRKQTGSFAESFIIHEEKFKEEMDKVERWRSALRQVADIAGMDSQNQVNGYEAQFIQQIIKYIGSKLDRTVMSVARYPIGTNSRVKDINSWLEDGSSTVFFCIICGMGGIGKTECAKIAYNLNYHKFEGSSFLANIREVSKQPNGLVRLQEQLVSDILKRGKINSIDEGITKIKDALCCKRVLVVLDDIDHLDQLNAIFKIRNSFCTGSKIIITTRNECLLNASYNTCKIIKVGKLDSSESLELFSLHAFEQHHPPEDYMGHSKSVVDYCEGLPLALQVLGSSLSGKNIHFWESKLKTLREIPDIDILKILKTSYDSLPDDNIKNLFLDIACFFVGMDKEYTITVLDGCDYSTRVGIENFIDRHLIAIDEENKLCMHKLIQDMGREIVCQESRWDPGMRSRLWKHKDALSVLKKKTGTKAIEGLFLNLDKPEKTISNRNNAKQHYFEDDALARMHRVRILSLNNVQLSGRYETFPEDIRLLCWHGFPLKSIPANFSLENLVVLDMQNSRLKHLWKETKVLGKLKILNLSYSYDLIKIPDFSGLPSLERLTLKNCRNLIKVHESIGELSCLVLLSLKGCKNLMRLPKSFGKLKSLKELYLSGCLKLTLPDLRQLESLRTLHANETIIITSSTSDFWWSLPSSLVSLSVAGCQLPNNDIPSDGNLLPLLRFLNLDSISSTSSKVALNHDSISSTSSKVALNHDSISSTSSKEAPTPHLLFSCISVFLLLLIKYTLFLGFEPRHLLATLLGLNLRSSAFSACDHLTLVPT